MTTRPPTQHRAIVVGTKFGARIHARALAVAGVDVVGLVGRDVDRTRHVAERAGIPHPCGSLAEALALDAGIVVVATPPNTHAPLVRTALEADRHVLCEKPFTLDLGEALDLERLARERCRVALLAHEFRFTECAALTRRLLMSGAIGEPRFATIVAHGGLVADPTRPMPDWWFDAASGGGWLGASGSHAIDRLRQWFGDIRSVSAQTLVTSDRDRSLADDTFAIRFTTHNGLEGTLSSSAAAWGTPFADCRVLGSTGSLWIDDRSTMGSVEAMAGPVLVADRDGTREVAVPDDLALTAPADLDPHYHRNVLPFAALYRSMATLIDTTAESSALATPPATFGDGVKAMQVMDAIRASAADRGRTLELDPIPADDAQEGIS